MYLQTLFLGMMHDADGSTVLDAAAGILEFSFSEDLTSRAFGQGL